MTSGNDFDGPDPAEQMLFSARLTPHRSLSRSGFMVLMTFVCIVSFAAGVAFLIMGAWPVFGFFGLDVLVIYWAFRLNFRHAKATEEISITHSELRVRRTSHRGHTVEWVLNPLWVQLDRRSTRSSASSGFIWSRAGAESRSQVFSVRTKSRVLSKRCRRPCKRQNAVRPTIRLADAISGIGWLRCRCRPTSES